MIDAPLELPRKKNRSIKTPAITLLLILALLALVYFFILKDDAPIPNALNSENAVTTNSSGEDNLDSVIMTESTVQNNQKAIDHVTTERVVILSPTKSATLNSNPNLPTITDFQYTPEEGANSDKVFTEKFIMSFATYLVENYTPANTKNSLGSTEVSFSSANAHYALKLTGLETPSNDPYAGRAYVLQYAYEPVALKSLYALLSDQLLFSMDMIASKNKLTKNQEIDMFKLYAQETAILANSVQAISNLDTFYTLFDELQESSKNYTLTQADFNTSLYTLNSRKFEETSSPALEKEISEKAKILEGIRLQNQKLTDNFLEQIYGNTNKTLVSKDELLYLAHWIARRGPEAAESSQAATEILNQMSVKLVQSASSLER